MVIRFFKFLIVILLFQNPLYSKNNSLNDINSHYLSNYFSGIVAYDNNNNPEALNFFKTSKYLIKNHDSYLKRYIYSLVLEGKVIEAKNEIKLNLTDSNSNFFEAHLILALDNLKNNKYKSSQKHLQRTYEFIKNDKISLVIVETLKNYLHVFQEKKIPNKKKEYGNFSFINQVFQRCYLNDENTETYFRGLINNQNEKNYSRYIFFYLSYLIENNNYEEASKISDELNYLNSTLLISQGKNWIEEKKFKHFNKIFSCKKPNDLLSELFFLVANLYSSQGNFEESNFYMNISYYLNPKFIYNLSLLADNYHQNKDYSKTLKFLSLFKKDDQFFYWYRLKKEAQIISQKEDSETSLDFISSKFKELKNPSIKIIFDFANLNKNSKKYKEAIKLYNQVLLNIDKKSELYSEILYRRGSSYERVGDYKNGDKDLIKSLEINPDDAYVLNYLAYSWLERDYKINEALQMLEKAYDTKSSDPYIIDSIGWAYYLVQDYKKAENFLRRAVELMPDDPTVNDHYADILWKMNRKMQARYFWQSVLNLEDTSEKMKKNIENKLIEGLEDISS
jgi:tetratricopeptide (TPR) repeat protein